MERLLPKEIRFIENYLKNSGVNYFDVRLELTDHVASELEERLSKADSRGFYEEFKEYMRLHKKALLKSLRRYQWQADKKVLRQILRNAWRPLNILGTIALVWLKTLFLPENWTAEFFLFPFVITMVAMWAVPYYLLGKRNFLSLNRLALLFFLFLYLGPLGPGETSLIELNNIWIHGLIILLYLAVIRTSYELIVFYRRNYQVS